MTSIVPTVTIQVAPDNVKMAQINDKYLPAVTAIIGFSTEPLRDPPTHAAELRRTLGLDDLEMRQGETSLVGH